VETVAIRLVPVEVFGANECSHCHQDGFGYGLSDAVSSWSDCNRAFGRIYRVDDLGGREEGDTVTVYVPRESLPFFERKFGEADL
jgi:hypothetical protein